MRRALHAAGLAAFLLAVPAVRADYGRPQTQTVFLYLGADWCTGCHNRQSSNPKLNVVHAWDGSAHARAWQHLPEDQRDNPACLRCHTTGYGMPRRADTSEADLRGVQCEACHGPGSHYFTWGVMKDRAKALSRGLVLPTTEVCTKCHW